MKAKEVLREIIEHGRFMKMDADSAESYLKEIGIPQKDIRAIRSVIVNRDSTYTIVENVSDDGSTISTAFSGSF